jgi:hypothetical protein
VIDKGFFMLPRDRLRNYARANGGARLDPHRRPGML